MSASIRKVVYSKRKTGKQIMKYLLIPIVLISNMALCQV
ncbi:uncharacterized protein METZ01_LOCUS93546, partial [marine metagenome]